MKNLFHSRFVLTAFAVMCGTSSALAVGARNVFAPANTLPELEGIIQDGSAETSAFDLDLFEPSHNPPGVPVSAGKSGWWRWVAPADGYCTVDTRRTRRLEQTVKSASVAVYLPPTLEVPNVGNLIPVVKSRFSYDLGTNSNNNYGKATFLAEAGKTYFIAVDATSIDDWDAVNHSRIGLDLRFYEPKNETRMGLVGIARVPGSQVGMASFILNKKGGYNGFVQMFGKRHRFRGQVSAEGYFYASVPQPVPPGGVPLAPMTLAFDVLEKGRVYSQDGSRGSSVTDFSAVVKYGKGNFFAGAGYYTYDLEMELPDTDAGFGLGSCTLTRTGGVRGSMELPDGQRTTYSAKLLNDAEYPTFLFVRHFFKGAGFAWFNLIHTGETNGLVANDAQCAYRRPAIAGSPFYPTGIDAEVVVEGGRYVVPPPSGTPFSFLSGSGGDGQMAIPATMGEDINAPTFINLTFSANKFLFDAPNPFGASIKFNRRTGFGSGKVRIPLSQAARNLRVVCRRQAIDDTGVMRGRLTGTTKTVKFFILPP